MSDEKYLCEEAMSGKCKEDQFTFDREIEGPDFDGEISLDALLLSYKNMGIQGSNLYNAIVEIKAMRKANAKVFFGCTSNMISCGIREIICFLCKHKHIDVLCTTGGGIEEDLIKCMKPTYLAEKRDYLSTDKNNFSNTQINSNMDFFKHDDYLLRECGWNRIGNMVINNNNYCMFELFMTAFFDEIVLGSDKHIEYNTKNNFVDLSTVHANLTNSDGKVILTPSEIIKYLGMKINNPKSVLYQCYKNNINVYSHALVDGSFGDMVCFYYYAEKLVIDTVKDIKSLNAESYNNSKNNDNVNGAIILGGGLVKHMIFNANLFNNGLEYCVLINTGVEYEASDAGAAISEGVSWGKVKNGRGVKVYGEASVIFPVVAYGGFKSEMDTERK